MKISRLHVRGFGKFKDFSTDFSNGLNVVYGPNESGKSTLMAFIKAMLYGLKSGRTSKDGVIADLKRYMPWDNSLYGGYFNFELYNGSIYRIDRNFENGEVKLYDSSFNDVTASFGNNRDGAGIAEKLIGLNQALFERTVFVSQMGTKIDNASSKDLIDRISNISQSGSEDISFKRAKNALKEALKEQVGTDRSYTRPLDIINARLEELNEEKSRIRLQNEAIAKDKAHLQELSGHIDILNKKQRLFGKVIEFCKLNEKLKVLIERAEEINFLSKSIRQSEKDINSMEKDMELLSSELEKKVKTVDPAGIAALLFAMGVSLGLLILSNVPRMFAAVPVLLAGIFFALRLRKLGSLKQGLEGENRAVYAEKLDHILHQQMVSLSERLTSERAKYEQLLKRLETQNLNYGRENIAAAEKEIDNACNDISELRTTIEKDLTNSEILIIDNVIEKYSETFSSEAAEMARFIEAQIGKRKIDYARLEAAIGSNEKIQDEEIIDGERERLQEQKRSLEQRGEALNIAIKTLEEAADQVQKKYIPVMNKVFKNTFSDLTAEKYSDIRAGENLNIMLNDPATDKVVPVSVLSNGTIDQLYLALRIAIAETVLKINERLPFIMDEPFAQYDDLRTEQTLKHIYEISRHQQIIIFTCKQREAGLINSEYPCKICSLT